MKFFDSSKLLLIAIILLAAFLRIYDVNWDQGNHLHPDERFLTMVGADMRLPHSLLDYLNPEVSTFNPAVINYPFYVYGTFPVVVTKLLAIDLQIDDYANLVILGRLLSAFADLFVVILIYRLVQLFEQKLNLHKTIKYWSAFFYAIAVLPIQLSHFFAVDTYVNTFCFASFYFVCIFYFSKKYFHLAIGGLLFGLAIGSKISAVYFAPLLLFFIIKSFFQHETFNLSKKTIYEISISCLLFGITAYIFGRIADPYLFQNGHNFFDPHLNQQFLANLKSLQSWSTPEAWFPPSVQWIHKLPVLFALQNLVFFGVGIVYALVIFVGISWGVVKDNKWIYRGILLWMMFFFFYESIQFSKTMRYFIMLYPFLAIFAAIGFYELTRKWRMTVKIILLITIIIWPLSFFSIYTKEHTRTTASRWIDKFIPDGSLLLSEHWDDALPIAINPPSTKHYVINEIHIFDPDTKQKWDKIKTQFSKSDYIILSSNRGWGSIPTVPERYPVTKKYYEDLLSNKTQFKKVAEFTSYPSLSYLGIPLTFPDDWSEEAFTVYDHPKVMIFKKQ